MPKKLQVFISSTYLDLIEERQAVVQAVLRSGHIPAGMELFVAGNRSQWETIKHWISESDVLILLLGARYGSIEEESGLSYTHLEVKHAESLNKPIACLYLNQEYLQKKVDAATGWASEVETTSYGRFREQIMLRLNAEISDIKDIHIETGRVLFECAMNPDLGGWVRTSEIGPDPRVTSELLALQEDNRALRTRLDIIIGAPITDSVVDRTIDTLNAYGIRKAVLVNGQWQLGEFLIFSEWMLHVQDLMSIHPHSIHLGHQYIYNQVAPHLLTYGMLRREAKSHKLTLGKNSSEYETTSYFLTDLGSRVLVELRRRKALRSLSS